MKKLKKVILLGRKRGAAEALHWLNRKGVEVPLVVADPKEKGEHTLAAYARKSGIPVLTSAQLYVRIEKRHPSVRDVDLVVSYLFAERMRDPLIALGSRGCINFHPAPLPDYKSRAGYNTAILDSRTRFGVSAHFVDSEKFDAGPIIKVKRFRMDPLRETAWSLEKKTGPHLFALFIEVMDRFMSGAPIRTKKNDGGLYLTSAQLEVLKEVQPTDSLEAIERKVRAFFFPPYGGAYLMLEGKRIELSSRELLFELARLIAK